ncbi:MAG: phosphatase PAP2 family protein [Planctomycetaceae bacterium]
MVRTAAILAAAAVTCILLDADAFITRIAAQSPDAVLSGLARFEAFGHGVGTLLIVSTACLAGGLVRIQQALLLVSAFGAGICASLLKVIFVRPRPFLLLSGQAEANLSTVVQHGSFSAALEHLRNSHLQAFPSAHTAAAFGLATALGHVVPNARCWWLVLATGCGLQRIFAQKHYASDVLAGASLGLLWAHITAVLLANGSFSQQRPRIRPAQMHSREPLRKVA